MTENAFSAALAQLAALEVPNVRSYALGAAPLTLTRAHLPALLIVLDAPKSGLFNPRNSLTPADFSGATHTLEVSVSHWLLTHATHSAMRLAPLALPTLIDAYFNALLTDARLGGALALPTRVSVEPSTLSHGGVQYAGCAFRHHWTLEVVP